MKATIATLYLMLLLSVTVNVMQHRALRDAESGRRGLVQVFTPQASDSATVRVDTLYVRDTLFVEIPIAQKIYRSDDFEAYISGFRPNLDSLFIYPKTVPKTAVMRRWTVGLSGGYGMTPAGFQPYVGIGFTYRMW